MSKLLNQIQEQISNELENKNESLQAHHLVAAKNCLGLFFREKFPSWMPQDKAKEEIVYHLEEAGLDAAKELAEQL